MRHTTSQPLREQLSNNCVSCNWACLRAPNVLRELEHLILTRVKDKQLTQDQTFSKAKGEKKRKHERKSERLEMHFVTRVKNQEACHWNQDILADWHPRVFNFVSSFLLLSLSLSACLSPCAWPQSLAFSSRHPQVLPVNPPDNRPRQTDRLLAASSPINTHITRHEWCTLYLEPNRTFKAVFNSLNLKWSDSIALEGDKKRRMSRRRRRRRRRKRREEGKGGKKGKAIVYRR